MARLEIFNICNKVVPRYFDRQYIEEGWWKKDV